MQSCTVIRAASSVWGKAMERATLLSLIAGTLAVPADAVTPDSDVTNTPKWDSLRQVILVTELAAQCGLESIDAEIAEATSMSRIRAILARHATVV